MTDHDPDAVLRLEPVAGPPAPPVVIQPDEPTVIGRAADCVVCLEDPSVSRSHASLTTREERWFVTDLTSRHGTFLNGIRLPALDPMPAASGDFLRMGPYTFRLEVGAASARTLVAPDDSTSGHVRVERVPETELESLAQRRLELLIDAASGIHDAESEPQLAEAILELVLAGTGYRRAAWVRNHDTLERAEMLVSRDLDVEAPGEMVLSRSLLREALSGHVVRLSGDAPRPIGESIVQLDIHSALCAPILLDEAVVGCLYLDSRAAEQPGFADAGSFCHAACRLAGLALSHLKRAALQRRQRQLDRDLEAARKAQAFLLPEEAGTVEDLRYAMRSRPGRIVAGDFFDLFPLGEGRIGICCGDVCGQGLGAAVMMTAILAQLRAALARTLDPAEVTGEINRYLTERSAADAFATMWLAVWDGAARELQYVDAGHGHWLVRPRDGAPAPAGRPGGLIVGIDPGHVYASARLELAPGDRLVAYSDGITEARNAAGEEFGVERLAAVVSSSDSPRADVAGVVAALQKFTGGAGLEDDTTIASIEVLDADEPT